MTASAHVPVLLDRVVSLFAPAVADGDSRSGSGAPVIVDCTLGLGGHTEALLQAYPQIEVVGIDRDPHALQASRERLAGFGDRFVAVHAVYDELDQVLAAQGCEGRVAGVLMDLGVSSMQLDQGERGFAYAQDAPLDMRMDDSGGRTAADVLNTASVGELTRILREYGDERYASRIARAVVAEREREPFRTSGRLVELLYAQIPAPARRTGGHPAKRTFQALRIEVNDELQVLARALPQVVEALAVGGRAVIEAYQSGEDRLVKRAFTRVTTTDAPPDLPFVPEDQQPTHRAVIRGAEKADQAEIDQNPRAASVRLRAIERVRPTTTNTGVNR